MTNPVWVTPQNVKFNGTLENAVVLSTKNDIRALILWDSLSIADKEILTDFIEQNTTTLASEATSGSQVINFPGLAIGPALITFEGTENVVIAIDGVEYTIPVTGSITYNFTTLINDINIILNDVATASLIGGNIVIKSKSQGAQSTVLVNDVFFKSIGATAISAAVHGTDASENLFDLAIKVKAPNGNPIFNQFSILYVGKKPPTLPNTPHTAAFIYWDGSVWRYLDNDATL
jgi:hypothetical protein